MKATRPTARLGSVMEFQNGRAFKKSEWTDSGLPIIRIQNLNDSAKPYNYYDGSYDKRVEVRDGDLLFAWSASLGPHIWKGVTGVLNQHIFRITPTQAIDKQYAYYALLYVTEELNGQTHGAVFGHITKDKLLAHPIPVPPVPEQKRIVAILDKVFAAITTATANAEKNLANAQELFGSYVDGVLREGGDGWASGAISDFVSNIATGPFGSLLHKSDYIENGIPLINPINIVGGSIAPDLRKTVGPETYERLLNYTVHAGDVVIARRGEMGRCAVVGRDEDGWLCGTGCFVIETTEKLDPQFLAHMLRSSVCREKLERVAGRATMPNLSNEDLARLDVALPPVELQGELLDHFDHLSSESRRLGDVYKREIDLLVELRQSILDRAFAGELTANPSTVESALSGART